MLWVTFRVTLRAYLRGEPEFHVALQERSSDTGCGAWMSVMPEGIVPEGMSAAGTVTGETGRAADAGNDFGRPPSRGRTDVPVSAGCG